MKDLYKKSRICYIVEATLEYLISILIGGAYLARLTDAVGISDSATGIISSLASCAAVAQLAALAMMNLRSVKRIVVIGHTINQLLFAFLYLTPFVPIAPGMRAIVLGGCLLTGHLISAAIHAAKINWFMALVDNHKRGIFTANKEIVSLLSGMAFTFTMSAVIDHYDAKGDQRGSFILLSITVFVMCVLHTLSMVLSKEKTVSKETVQREKVKIRDLVRNKSMLKVILVSVLWHMINSSVTPFFGSYQNKELGFSMLFVSVVSAIGSLSRVLASRPMGRFADKYSFSKMLVLCFGIQALSALTGVFTVPSNGHVMFIIYFALHYTAMAGINSSMINLMYDYVPSKMRMAALSFQSILGGLAGFLTTLVCSRLLEHIQAAGNRFLGLSVYAQQVLSAISAVFSLLTIVYLCTVVCRTRRVQDDGTSQG